MKRFPLHEYFAIAVLSAFAVSNDVSAQSAPPPDTARAAELAAARERLAEAAREVARLSSEVAGPWAGEFVRRLSPGPRAMLGLNIENADGAVRVRAVSPGGPAAEAGVLAGDLIVAIDGVMLYAGDGRQPVDVLLGQLADVAPGERVSLTVRRDGSEHPVAIETVSFEGRMPERRLFATGTAPIELFRPGVERGAGGRWLGFVGYGAAGLRGLELVALTPGLGSYFGTEQGLLVVRIAEDNELGLRDGDVILDIGGRTPNSPEHAMRILASFAPGESLRVGIMRERRRTTLEFDLPPADAR